MSTARSTRQRATAALTALSLCAGILATTAAAAIVTAAPAAATCDPLTTTPVNGELKGAPYTVPVGVSEVHLQVVGAPGHGWSIPAGANHPQYDVDGGRGSQFFATLAVSPGDVVQQGVLAGAPGGLPGVDGKQPGEAGGAAGWVTVTAAAAGSCARLVVMAAGGGGAGRAAGPTLEVPTLGGAGGDADTGTNNATAGGNGGDNDQEDGGYGGPASTSTGGSAGAHGHSTNICRNGNDGQAGAFESGGAGGNGHFGDGAAQCFAGDGAGGGGAGYYYGGGGGSGYDYYPGGGGGGGSSYLMPGLTQAGGEAVPYGGAVPDPQIIPVIDTAVALSSSANPSAQGSSVTFSAKVTTLDPGGRVDGGTVRFSDGNLALFDATAVPGTGGSATATFVTSGLSTGTHHLSATYKGFTEPNALFRPTLPTPLDQGVTPKITFTSTPPAGAKANGTPYVVTATDSSDLPIVLSINVASSAVCTISGATVSFVGAGKCTIDADQAATDTLPWAVHVHQDVTVAAATLQTITFTSDAPIGAQPGDTYHPTATGGASGNPVTFNNAPHDPCGFDGTLIHFQSGGVCHVVAHQNGGNGFAPADAEQTIAIGPIPDVIQFNSTPPANPVPGDTYSYLSVQTGGFNLVVLSLDPASVGCTKTADVVSGFVTTASVTFTGVGTCIITATTAGRLPTFSAASAQQTVVVKAPQAITFTSPANQANPRYGGSYELSATGGASGKPVTFTVTTPQRCTISAGHVSFLAAGLCQILADQVGNGSYTPAPTQFFNAIVVTAPLSITSPDRTFAYGASLPANFTPVYSGFVAGDTVASLDVPPTCTPAGPATQVGTYQIRCIGVDDPNYQITVTFGTLTITRAPLTVTWPSQTLAYGGAVPTTFPPTYTGFAPSESVTNLTTPATCSPTPAVGGVGTYHIACSGAVGSNYTFSYPTTTLTITPTALSVNADAKTKAYGASDPPLTATLIGFVNGDTASTAGITGSPLCSRSPGETVGPQRTITCTPGTLAAPGYVFASGTSAGLSITRATLLVNADAKTKVYGASDPALSATLSGFVNGDTAANTTETGTASCTRTGGETVAGAPYAISCTPGSLATSNYTFAAGSTAVLSVTRAVLSVNAASTSKVYGSLDPVLTAASITGFQLSETTSSAGVTGTAACSRVAGEPVSGSPYAITCTGGTLSAANYSFVTGTSAGLAVTKASLSVDAAARTKTYGSADLAFGWTFSGYKNGDTAGTTTITGSASCSRAVGEAVGLYTITCLPGTLTTGNYVIGNGTTAALTIQPAVLSVDAVAASKSFGAADPGFTATYSGFVHGDTAATTTITGSPDCGRASGESVAGSPYPITCGPGSLATPDYTFANGSTAPFSIGTTTLAVNADPKSKVYGATDPALTATLSGFQGTQNAGNGGITGSAACTRDPGGSVASPAPITCSPGTLSAPGYTFVTGATADLTMTPAKLSVFASAASKPYGAPDPVFAWTFVGYTNGDTAGSVSVTGTAACTRTAGEGTGTRPITCAPGTLATTNYTFQTGPNALLTITKATLLMNAVAKTKSYGAADPAFTFTFSALQNGDGSAGATGTAACTRAPGESVTGSPYAISCAPGTLTSLHYTFVTGSTAPLAISRAVLLVDGGAGVKTYGDADPALVATLSGFVGGDTAASTTISGHASCTRGPGESVTAGPYAITCVPGSLATADYTFAAGAPGLFKITPARLSVDADGKVKTYGDPDPALTATLSGFVNGDTAGTVPVAGSAACTRASGETVGSSPYAITCAPGSLATADYTFGAGATAGLTITRAGLLVAADPASKVYGADDPALTATITGFRGSDSVADVTGAPACTRAAGESVTGGPYEITCTPGTLDLSGYTFGAGSPANLTITPAVLGVQAQPKTKVYGGVEPALTSKLTGFVHGDTASATTIVGDASCTRATGETVGASPYTITCTPGSLSTGDYTFATGPTANLTITPASLSVGADAKTKRYGDPDPALTATLTGFQRDDTAATAGIAGTPTCTHATGETVTAGPYEITCTAGTLTAGNYTFATGHTADLTITTATLSVDAVAQTKTYGANDPALTTTLRGFQPGDTTDNVPITGHPNCTRAAGESPEGSPYLITCGVGTLSAANYAFVPGATAELGITWLLHVDANAATKTYGELDPAFTSTIRGLQGPANPITGSASCTRAGGDGVAGSPYPITCTPGTLSAPHSTFVTGDTASLEVAKAVLHTDAPSYTKVYGDPTPALHTTLSGFVNGDTATTTTMTGAASCAADPAGVVTPSPMPITCTPGSLAAPDYTFAPGAAGSFTVTPATLAVDAVDATKSYGAGDPTFTATFSGYVNGDSPGSPRAVIDPALASDCTRAPGETVAGGPYAITCAPGSLETANYRFVTGSAGTLTITATELRVDAVATTKVYGADDPMLDHTLSGFEGTQTAAATSITGTTDCSRAHGESVAGGPYTITCAPGTLAATGYTFVTGSTAPLAISRAVLLVDGGAGVKTYGDADPALVATLSGFVGGDTAASTTISGHASCTRGPGESVTAGPYAITCVPGSLATADYTFAAGAPGLFKITPARLSVDADGKVKTYGDPDPALTATLSGFVNGDTAGTVPVAGSAACTRASGETVGSSPYAITCAPGSLATADYTFGAGATAGLTITRAGLLVAADPASKVYGADDPALTATITGFHGSDSVADVTGAPACTRAAGESVTGGPYEITCTPGTLDLSGYTFGAGSPANLTITPAVLGVQAQPKTKVYGGVEPALTSKLTGFVHGDTASATTIVGDASCTRATGETVGASPYTITCTPGSLSTGDYTFATGPTANLTITPASLSVGADAKTKRYGDPDPALTATLTGFQRDDTAATAGIAGTPTCTRATGETVTAGPYEITCTAGTLTAGNYTFATGHTADLTITTATLSVDAVAQTKTYGANDPALTTTLRGFQPGDTTDNVPITGHPNCTRAAGQTVAGGPYTITCTPGTLHASDYTFVAGTAAVLTVTPASLAVDAQPATKTYAAPDPTLTAKLSGFVGGDTASSTVVTGAAGCTRVAGESVAAGPYAITCVPGSLASANYSFATGAHAALTVTRAALTLVPDPGQQIVYGTGGPALTGRVVGIRNADPVSAAFSSAVTATSVVGSYPITSAAVGAPEVLDNYDITHGPATVAVTKAALVIAPATGQSIAYGTGVPILTGTISGLRNADPLTARYSSAVTATTPVGTYPITSAAVGTPAVLANYAITLTPGTVAVTKAPLSVTPTNVTRAFSVPNPTLTGAIVGIANHEPITATYATTAVAASPVGSYTITATFHDVHGELANYAQTRNVGTLMVVRASSTSTLTAAPNPVVVGKTVTLTATVAHVAPATVRPTGTVTFLEGTTVLGTGTLTSKGKATLVIPTPHAGTRALTAAYAGDTHVAGSTATAVSLTTQRATTRIVAARANLDVVAVKNGPPYKIIRLNAVLDRPDTGAKLAGQTLVFTTGTTLICTITTDAKGAAQCNTTIATLISLIQNHGYTVTFAGAPDYLPSTGKGAA